MHVFWNSYFNWQMGSLNPLLLNLHTSMCTVYVAFDSLNTCTNKTIHSPSHPHTQHTPTYLPSSLNLYWPWPGPRTHLSGSRRTHGPTKVNMPGPGTYWVYCFEPNQGARRTTSSRRKKGKSKDHPTVWLCIVCLRFVDDYHSIHSTMLNSKPSYS